MTNCMNAKEKINSDHQIILIRCSCTKSGSPCTDSITATVRKAHESGKGDSGND